MVVNGLRKSEGSRFQRDGVVKVKDLFVILRSEGFKSESEFVLNCQEVAQIRRLVEL